jgi:hypothetical protein
MPEFLPWRTYQLVDPFTSKASKFLDSPFTWGGIGVLIGIATTSPPLFRAAFVGAGIAIGIQLLRSQFLEGKSGRTQFVGTALLIIAFSLTWWKLWNKIPKPSEPLTKGDVVSALHEVGNSTTFQSAANDNKPITKAELVDAFRNAKPIASAGITIFGVPTKNDLHMMSNAELKKYVGQLGSDLRQFHNEYGALMDNQQPIDEQDPQRQAAREFQMSLERNRKMSQYGFLFRDRFPYLLLVLNELGKRVMNPPYDSNGYKAVKGEAEWGGPDATSAAEYLEKIAEKLH